MESRNEGGHVIDLYTGAADAATRPIVVLVPGGGWCHGDDARLYRLLAARVAKRSRCRSRSRSTLPGPSATGRTWSSRRGCIVGRRRRPGGVVAVGLSAGAHLVAGRRRGAAAAAALCSGRFGAYAHESRRSPTSRRWVLLAGKMFEYSPICGSLR